LVYFISSFYNKRW